MVRILFVLILLASFRVQAQPEIEVVAEEAAAEICTCFNMILEEMNLHPELIKILKDMKGMTGQEAELHMMSAMMALGPEVQQEVVLSMQEMQSFEEIGDRVCPDLGENFAEFRGTDEFKELVVKELEQQSECEMAHLFYSMSTKGD